MRCAKSHEILRSKKNRKHSAHSRGLLNTSVIVDLPAVPFSPSHTRLVASPMPSSCKQARADGFLKSQDTSLPKWNPVEKKQCRSRADGQETDEVRE